MTNVTIHLPQTPWIAFDFFCPFFFFLCTQVRPGRIDRKIEFGLPDLKGRSRIFNIHAKTMSCDRDIRFDLLARMCPNTTGAEIRSVCTEAGMYAIRGRRKSISEKDFLDSIEKVIKGYKKFSSTPKYMVYN